MNVFTIPSGTPFLRALALGLLDLAGSDPAALTRMRVFLPTRRACRSLQSAFVSLEGGKPLLLPRLQPIGDVESDELDMLLAGTPSLAQEAGAVPPAMPPLQRQLILARLIRQKDQDAPAEQILSLAACLGRLIDQVHTEELDFSALQSIAPPDLSQHWELTLDFLKIVTESWPSILAERGRIDLAERRVRLVKTLAKLWQDSPPEYPVIAAGSTGSIPSTAQLLSVIANLEKGSVILPGLDQDLELESWEAIMDSHPQATMKQLLEKMSLAREQVAIWPAAKSFQKTDTIPRIRLIREIMRPANAPHGKSPLLGQANQIALAMKGVRILEAANLHEESLAIALAIRETLESPDKTVCLVTPDRELARRVSSALLRWNISVDDSAGTPLEKTAPGQFLIFTLAALAKDFSPVDFLSLLRHPLTSLAEASLVSDLENILRGPKPPPGLPGIAARLPREDKDKIGLRLHELLTKTENSFAPLLSLRETLHPASAWVNALTRACEQLSDGPDLLWRGVAGEEASAFLSDLALYGDALPDLSLQDFCAAVRQLMKSRIVRPRGDSHPRVTILGQLEARLIAWDVVILSSLNEETWPEGVNHDPWMSRPMRRKFGLPGEERSIGLSAHDFAQGFCAETAILTRSVKVAGTQTIPARWLQRLSVLLKAAGTPTDGWRNDLYLRLARKIDEAESAPPLATCPAPCPPIQNRPRQLSVTWIEKWMANPYRLYAEKILRLSPLGVLDEDVDAADRGTLIHKILENFLKKYPDHLPPNIREEFLALAQQEITLLESLSPSWHYWWPRLERIADFIAQQEPLWRKQAAPWLTETTGEMEIQSTTGEKVFTLTAKADRIDRLKEGGAAIIDYKTGTPPSFKDLQTGKAPQLPLEALILEAGGFGTAMTAARIDYWRLSGGTPPGVILERGKNMEDLLAATKEGIHTLIAAYRDPTMPYEAKPPARTRLYEDEKQFLHLARTAEWSSGDEDGEEEDLAS